MLNVRTVKKRRELAGKERVRDKIRKLGDLRRKRKKKNMNIRWNPMEHYQEQNTATTTSREVERLEKKLGQSFKDLEHRHRVVMEDIREKSEEVLESLSSRVHHSSYPAPPSYHPAPPSYHPAPPSYHPPPPSYSPSHPTAYKAVYEVDFTPIFLSLLPLFLVLGTLLGLLLPGLSLTTTTTTTNAPSVTVNVNSTSSSTSTATGGTGNNATTTSILPIFIYPNGTLALPLVASLTGLLNLSGLFGLGFPGLIIGRSLATPLPPLACLLASLAALLLGLVARRTEDRVTGLVDAMTWEEDKLTWEEKLMVP